MEPLGSFWYKNVYVVGSAIALGPPLSYCTFGSSPGRVHEARGATVEVFFWQLALFFRQLSARARLNCEVSFEKTHHLSDSRSEHVPLYLLKAGVEGKQTNPAMADEQRRDLQTYVLGLRLSAGVRPVQGRMTGYLGGIPQTEDKNKD